MMNMIESLTSKSEKLKMFLLYYFISLNVKLVGDGWKIYSYNLKFKIKIYFFINYVF